MEISPEKQNIDQLFSNTPYEVDFYQRDYKWGKAEVQRLLADIAYIFDQAYSTRSTLDVTKENIDQYPWYYLNTYITNKAEGKNFIVDGQQRLTTLTLILVKLFHLAVERVEDRVDLLKARISGSSIDGKVFWLAHQRRHQLMEKLISNPEGLADSYEYADDVTLSNMVKNYFVIASILDSYLADNHKLQTFILYFLSRLVIVNLDIQPANVPMVFEVINDRGVRLKPYEILKGKILGKLAKSEVISTYHNIWEDCMCLPGVQGKEDYFWETFLKSRFAETMVQARDWDNDYHRRMFEEPFATEIGLNDQIGIKRFLEEDLLFFSTLFSRISILGNQRSVECPEAYYNIRLNDLDGATMLCLAVCDPDDDNADAKIFAVNQLVDRLHAQIRLSGIYESRKFLDLLYGLKNILVGKAVEEFEGEATKLALQLINERLDASFETPFIWQRFRNIGYGELETRFIRYLLARVENWLSKACEVQLRDTFYNLVRNNGKIEGYHIEHILSRNETNKSMFEDDEQFEQERNRLGGLLLLRGSANQSSGNEEYQQKLKSYFGTLLWNESLTEEFYKANIPLRKYLSKNELTLMPLQTFGPEEIEARTKLLFRIINKIWVQDNA